MGDRVQAGSRNFPRIKLRGKLVLSFVAFLLLAFLLAGVGSYRAVFDTMSGNIINLAQISSSQINKNVDSYIYELYRLTGMTFSDNQLQDILQDSARAKTTQERMRDTRSIQRFLFNIYSFRPDLYSVWLQTSEGKTYTEGFNRYVGSSYSIEDEPWYRQLEQDPDKNFFVVGRRYSTQTMSKHQGQEVFTVARRVIDASGQELGVFLLDVSYESFAGIFAEPETNQEARIFLLDENGALLYRSTADGLQDGDNLRPEELSESKYFIVRDHSAYTGWQVVMAIPRTQLFGSLSAMFHSLLLLLCISAALAVVLFAIFSTTVTKPLKRLAASMQKVEGGDFSVQLQPSANDEIGELSLGFNHMLNRINLLLGTMVELEVREKESEYKALQSQINPHFLYNTLEAIRMKCVVRGEPEIGEIINTLGNLFRLSIDRKEKFVSVADELEHVRSYMTIQNFRFDNKYSLHIHTGQGLEDCRVFKLMLQPLVENCVFHGLELKPDSGTIDIHITCEGGDLVIVIRDDGMGMDEDTYRQLVETLASGGDQKDQRSVGLRNVSQRIKLMFGEPYGLQVQSQQGQWTEITIRMPIMGEEEVDCYV